MLNYFIIAYLILVCSAAHANTVSMGNDIVYRFSNPTPTGYTYATAFLFASEWAPGDGFYISQGTTPGGSSLGTYFVSNLSSFPIIGFTTYNTFPAALSETGTTYLTASYGGTDVHLDSIKLDYFNPESSGSIDGVIVKIPRAFVNSPPPSPGNQGASVISSFRNYSEGAKNTDKTYLERINECVAQGADCDFDAVRNDQEFRQNLQNAADATYASKDLVTRTSLLPQNKLEIAAEAPTLIGEIKAFFQWIGVLPENENRDVIINASVEGESGEFTVNPTFVSYGLTYNVEFERESFFEDLVGDQFLFNKRIGNGEYFAGYGFVESVDDLGNGNKRVIFSISQLESNNALTAIPLPAGVYLFMTGLFVLGTTRIFRSHTPKVSVHLS